MKQDIKTAVIELLNDLIKWIGGYDGTDNNSIK